MQRKKKKIDMFHIPTYYINWCCEFHPSERFAGNQID